MPLPPLTHHEIMGLIEPFTRRGRRVDLDASDRLARRLVFRPLDHPDPEGGAALHDALELESPYRGTFRLSRTVTHPSGLAATLVAEGSSPEAVLAQAEALPPLAQFRTGEGYVLALAYQVEQGAAAAAAGPWLVGAEARVGGLTFSARMPSPRGAADLRLADPADEALALPEDLFAVLGWNWAPLRRDRDGWSTKLRLPGRGPERRRRAEAALELGARHLARTLAEPPPRFHERFLAARWGSVFRRVIPVLTAVVLVGGISLLPREALEDPALRLVLLNLPLLVIGLSFTLQERSRVEIPPWPRRPTGTAWRRAPALGP
jgi:hypothetical protein